MARAAAAIPIRPVLGALRLRNSLSNSLAALSNSQETISPVCQLEQVFHDLCSQYGIRTEVTVAVGTWGLGLHQSTRHVKAPTQSSMGGVDTSLCLPGISLMQQPSATSWASCSRQHQLLVAVPLHLVLSCSIPGCSPSPQETPVELRHLLYDTCCSKSWELQVAALLLWARRQPADTVIGGFWSRYAAAFLPSAENQQSLLLWSREELQMLQDDQLMETAIAWQQQVQVAYHDAVRPYFDSMYAADGHGGLGGGRHATSTSEGVVSGTSCSINRPPGLSCSLQEWLWAVATVESRAFGVTEGAVLKVPQRRRRSENGAADAGKVGNDLQQECRGTTCNNTHTASAYELVGLVPVLDLANHACHTDCHHSIDQHSSTFNLFQASGDSIQHSRGEYRAAAAAAGNEVMITYGEKSNRQLMEQYGFCVPGNPFDRIQLCDHQTSRQQFMSHKAVKQAAGLVKQQLLLQQQCSSPRPDVSSSPVLHNSQRLDVAALRQTEPKTEAAAQLFAAQVDAAVASVVSAAGWRNLKQYRLVTASSTAQCAELLLAAVQARLQTSATSLQEDVRLLQQHHSDKELADSAISGTSMPRRWSAVQYRMGQKQLLAATEQLLKAIISMQCRD